MLTQEILVHFNLSRNPFMDDVRGAEDIYLNKDSHFILAAMRDVAHNQGILAISGESGAGKTVLRRLFMEELKDEDITFIFPRSLDEMWITEAGLCDAIIAHISIEFPKLPMKVKERQVKRLLHAAAQKGHHHVLIIEEAHDLTVPMLMYLNRLRRMVCIGNKSSLGIILIGQHELRNKLAARVNDEIQTFSQRCIQVELEPLNKHLKNYLAFKFKRVGGDIGSILEDKAIEAIGNKLMRHDKYKGAYSIAHPLVVNGLVAKAMNLAVELGDALVTADLIKEV